MALVDLRGREGEPEVRQLLDPRPGWLVVGWSNDAGLAACAGLERVSDAELAVRAIGATDPSEGCALLEAVARVAVASRLVVETDGRAAGLYESCGFSLERTAGSGERWVRLLGEREAPPRDIGAATLGEVEAAIRASWGRDTSDDPDEWSTENPARGQCSVTALLVRELLGGEILVANVLRDGRRVERHAWNRLPSGLTVDLTREQFQRGERFGQPSVEEPLLSSRNPERYATLRARARNALALS